MGLDSSLKRDAAGFARYYTERSQRLAGLEQGYVRFHLQLQPEPAGGRLLLRVEDSGAGFDPQAVMAQTLAPGSLSGRGLQLVRQLAERCSYTSDGRGVCVEFCWSTQAEGGVCFGG